MGVPRDTRKLVELESNLTEAGSESRDGTNIMQGIPWDSFITFQKKHTAL